MREQSALTVWQWLNDFSVLVLDWLFESPEGLFILNLLILLLITSGLIWGVARGLTWLGRTWLSRLLGQVWFEALRQHGVISHLSAALPLFFVASNLHLLHDSIQTQVFSRALHGIGLFFLFRALSDVLSTWADMEAQSAHARTRSIKGYIELARILAWAVFLVLAISTLLDRSPLLMLSGLGALSAVLMLVFKDTLLSLVASAQMSSNDMLRIGDWIEMPQARADGFVIDMALHTVKVQNWDKTVTTIPTYKLFSESYRNWRHMFESGGRRIQRRLRIDASSVHFLDDTEIAALSRYTLLHDYLTQKWQDVEATNKQLGEAAVVTANRRRLTNIGTFRAYALAYLQSLDTVHQDMILMVRMMEPDAQGIPIELYAFTNTTAWVDYERIQGDIFDHLLAILPEMGLRLYQAPSGADVAKISVR